VLFGVYIDDRCSLALVPWSCLGSLPSAGELLAQEADTVYEDEGWPKSKQKDQCDLPIGQMWGITIEGTRGVVGINRLQRMQLASVTLERLSSQWTGRQFCSLLGLWSAVLQRRRPGYALLASCFTAFSPDNLDELKYLPLAAKN
jgi:hypothetical protein